MNELPSRRAVLVYSACLTAALIGVVVLAFATRPGGFSGVVDYGVPAEPRLYTVHELHRAYTPGMNGRTVRVRGRVLVMIKTPDRSQDAITLTSGSWSQTVLALGDLGFWPEGSTVTVEGVVQGRTGPTPADSMITLRGARVP